MVCFSLISISSSLILADSAYNSSFNLGKFSSGADTPKFN